MVVGLGVFVRVGVRVLVKGAKVVLATAGAGELVGAVQAEVTRIRMEINKV